MKYAFILSFLISVQSWAQYDIEDAKNSDTTDSKFNRFELKERIYVGGELGLSVSPGGGYILLAPIVGYDLTEHFSAGISTMYQLYRFRTYSGTFNLSTVGMGVFGRYRPIDQLILQAEFDVFNTVDFVNGTSYKDRTNVPAFMTGLGYAGGGSKSYYQIIVLYDFINNPNMPLPPFIFNRLHLKMGMIWHLN